MRAARILLLLLVALLPVAAARADLVVVVNPRSGVDRLTREEVVYVFMGRWRQFVSGVAAVPVDAPPESPERTLFYRQLVNKEPADIRAYWSRLVFSGGARPPLSAPSREELMKTLAATPGAIGYIDRSLVDGRVKVVFEFGGNTP